MPPLGRTAHHGLSFGQRLAVAICYVAALIGVGVWAHSGWPPSGAAGIWFYSAAIAVILSVFVAEPFYTSPRVALANGAALALIALTAGRDGLEASKHVVATGRAALIALGAVVFVVALVAIVTSGRSPRTNKVAYEFARNIGSGYVLYGLVYVASAYAAFAAESGRLTALLFAALVFTWGPVERLVPLAAGLRRPARQPWLAVVATEDPGTVIATAPQGTSLEVGDVVEEARSREQGVVVDITQSAVHQQVRVAFPASAKIPIGRPLHRLEAAEREGSDVVVGYSAPHTTMNTLRVAAGTSVSSTDMEEGRLVGVDIRAQEVLYQVTEAELVEDTVAAGVHARFEVRAQKLGIWDAEDRSFDLIPWVPDPGVPVRLKVMHETHFDVDGVGCVPGTSFTIRYHSTPAITHNTAILGILGSGKTTLARELACRNLAAGVKVVVLDITGQYSSFFDDLCTPADVAAATARVNDAIRDTRDRVAQDEDRVSFGNRGVFIRTMRQEFAEFLASNSRLRIYNPLSFNVSTIEGFPRNRVAELLREATTVEKTSYVATALLNACADLGETNDARVCLVLEEAHSLTPEPTEGGLTREDQRAVHQTARAVLQGRKYGYGCLLISQRTANVTKTILNQCHTVFALRSYDATGISFLSNYLGDSYSKLLSSLPQFHCAAFGAGISCAAPVIVRLNDPREFDATFWEPRLAQLRDGR